MIRLFPCPVREPKAVKDFQAPDLQTVSLSRIDFRPSLVNDASIDTTPGHPCCHHHTRWTGANNENIAFRLC
jgi:hypothetical protein